MPDEAARRRANRRHFDRWAASYERDRTSQRLATLQHEALAMLALTAGDRLLDVGCGIARVLAPGGRAVIADATTDRPIMRLADLLLRRFQRSHVGLRRTAELRALMLEAGLEPRETRRLMNGVYAIVVAVRR